MRFNCGLKVLGIEEERKTIERLYEEFAKFERSGGVAFLKLVA